MVPPWHTGPVTLDAQSRLRDVRLYFVCDARPGGRAIEDVVGPALAGGVDMVQLRDKGLGDNGLRAAAAQFRKLADAHGALFVLNDRPDIAAEVGADGVHLGQDDTPVAEARSVVGPDAIIGLSTHAPDQLDAGNESGADYLSVGPIEATPTKPGRPATGLEYVRYAAAHATLPFFAIGGVTAQNIGAAVAAGARRAVVVRAIAEAPDPERAARELREALDRAVAEAEAHAEVIRGTS
jgi:thiamine-phosphate pyrophosphorylase